MSTITKYLTRNATIAGSQYQKGAEIRSDHPAFKSLERDGWLVSSKGLVDGDTKVLSSGLDDANKQIKELLQKVSTMEEQIKLKDEEISSLKTDLTSAIEELQKKEEEQIENQ